MKKKECDLNLLIYRLGFLVIIIIPLGIFIWKKLIIQFPFLKDCFFYSNYHIYCPGCGGTRAIQFLLEGDILKSLQYHPIVLYSVIIYLYYMIAYTIKLALKKIHFIKVEFHIGYLYGAFMIIILNCFIKNFL